MEPENLEHNNERPIESVYSTRIRAGKRRTYFFDVRATRSNDYFLTITESRKRFDNNGYDRHKIFIYKEDFNKFIKAVTEAMDFVKTELMPDFDFNAFNHDEENTFVADENKIVPAPIAPNHSNMNEVNTTSIPVQEVADIDPETITEKKPLEARDSKASEGDNMSQEQVDKW